MTTVSIMQPYFFPYLGYFQLIAASDVFVLYDDAQYIRSGWSNRNRIERGGIVHYLTLPVHRADFRLPYNRRMFKIDQAVREQILRSIEEAYKKAPRFADLMPLIRSLMNFEDPAVSKFNRNIIEALVAEVGLETVVMEASELKVPEVVRGSDRVLAICRELHADRYLNMINGSHLYDSRSFSDEGVELKFLRPILPNYEKQHGPAEPGLSIIDVLMFNDPPAVRSMLDCYEIV